MKSVIAANGTAFVLALVASMCASGLPWLRSAHPDNSEGGGVASAAALAPAELVDHERNAIPRRDYRRIVSGSTVADALLLELCEPNRVVAFTAYSARSSAQRYRFAGKPAIDSIGDLEGILALHPDLVLINGTGDRRAIARLREAGLMVFDLGEMRGLSTLVPNIHDVAEILGHPERGERFARAIVEQMKTIGADVPWPRRRRAMYLSVYGGNLFGAAEATSYHDVLVASGLLEAAAGYRDWPQYTAEQILILDPDVIVTNAGMRPRICEHAGLAALRACESTDGVVELDGDLLGDPGPSMVDAARALRVAAYGSPTMSELTRMGTNP
jgi:iron complex transport system substrate-binding protein